MKRNLPLRLPDDSIEMTAAIDAALAAKLAVHRTSPYHLKSGRANFWPSSGKVIVDGQESKPLHGLEEFIRAAGGRRFIMSLTPPPPND